MSKTSADGTEWKLVVSLSCFLGVFRVWQFQFSDEFNVPGRTFYDGDDPFFQGVDLWYGVTQDLEVCYLNNCEHKSEPEHKLMLS